MTRTALQYIPALGFPWLTPLYDPLLRWGMREETFKRELIKRVEFRSGAHVLDLGCGTGTLTIMLKQASPAAHVTGLDADPQMLSIGLAKADRVGASIQWDQGMACALPYPENSFDVVVSSLVVHHLQTADKLRAFREVLRVLRPGGGLHIIDFGSPTGALTRLQAAVMRRLEHAADNLNGRILPMLKEAGLAAARQAAVMNTIFGPIWLYEAGKPLGV